jgi:methyl-accepting chemotaxis protein
MKSQMTIGKKLMISFSVMALLTLVLSFVSLSAIGKIGGALETTINRDAKRLELVGEITTDLSKLRTAQRGVIMYTQANNRAKVDANKQAFETAKADLAGKLASLLPMLVTDEEKNAANVITADLTQYFSAYQEIAKACDAGNPSAALEIAASVGTYGDEMEKRAGEISSITHRLLTLASQEGASATSTSRWTAGFLIVLTLIVGAAAAAIVFRINQTLRSATADLAEGAEQITSASAQVATSSQSLAQGASEQAASLEETSASSEEITSMTRKNSENSSSAADLMNTVDKHVHDGNRTLEQMVVSMSEINASSDKISKIIKVIDEIAFQTNILALNAAVEAARAGEAGMGFAVVADEVRNLAQRSAQAAKDTTTLIQESIAKSNDGSTRLQQVTEVIRAITESSSKVKILVDEVKLGSQEQSHGVEQISKAIQQMDLVTQSTAASAEESASASQELSAQAQAMNQVVRRLWAMVGGQAQRAA